MGKFSTITEAVSYVESCLTEAEVSKEKQKILDNQSTLAYDAGAYYCASDLQAAVSFAAAGDSVLLYPTSTVAVNPASSI